MTAPRPALVSQELSRLIGSYDSTGKFHPGTLRPHDPKVCGTTDESGRLIECLQCLYAWVFNAAHQRTVSEMNGSRGAIAYSNPTENIGNSDTKRGKTQDERPNPKAVARAHCERAYKRIREVIVAVETVDSMLSAAMGHTDVKHGPEDKSPGGRLYSDADWRQYTEAAARRRSRGEGYGEG